MVGAELAQYSTSVSEALVAAGFDSGALWVLPESVEGTTEGWVERRRLAHGRALRRSAVSPSLRSFTNADAPPTGSDNG